MRHPGAGRTVRVHGQAIRADHRDRVPQYREQVLLGPPGGHHEHRAAVRDEQVHVGQLIIPFGIDDGQPEHSGESIADRLWAIHAERGEFRTYAEALPDPA